jgi:TPR repeat protein
MAKARDSYLLAQVITAKFQGAKLMRQRIFWIVVCYALAMANASANINTPMVRSKSLLTHIPVATVGYRAPWLKHLREQARRATREDEHYLANLYWRILARNGDREAAFRLGVYYDQHGHTDADARRAVYWYRQAAMAGEIHAQHNLGVAYANGKGVAMNMRHAVKWWTRAARLGNPDSQYNLGIIYAQGEFGIKRNIALAKHWWHEAAQHGDAMAQFNLGALYVNSGIHDYCAATRWWHKAARQGVEQAVLALRAIRLRTDYKSCE